METARSAGFMEGISGEDREVALLVATALRGEPTVARFYDDRRTSYVDILSSKDQPQVGVTSFSTIGLSRHPLIKDGSEYAARLELVSACGSSFSGLDYALTSAAFCVINSKWFCFPGAIFPDVLSMHGCSSTLQHFFFVPPFLWEELGSIRVGEKTVAWLLAVPISDTERTFAQQYGSDALERRFVEEQIDFFNLNRESIV